eukprot:4605805-Pyramimonas_sp.AAC.1
MAPTTCWAHLGAPWFRLTVISVRQRSGLARPFSSLEFFSVAVGKCPFARGHSNRMPPRAGVAASAALSGA